MRGARIAPTEGNSMSRSNVKVMLMVCFDWQGVIHYEFIPHGQTVNKEFYVAVLKRMREAVRRKRPQLWTNQNWVLHHDIFWWKTKRPLYPSHPTLQVCLQRTFSCFLSWSLPWKDAVSTHFTRSRKIRRRSSPFGKKRSKVGRNFGSGVLLAKETTLKATNVNKLYLSTYSFYYNSPAFYYSYLVKPQTLVSVHSTELQQWQSTWTK